MRSGVEPIECPLCNEQAERHLTTGDWKKYCCPACGEFDIHGSVFEEIKNDPQKRVSYRELAIKQHLHGRKVALIGSFPATHKVFSVCE